MVGKPAAITMLTAPVRSPSGPIELGAFEPKDGQFILRVEVVGANRASKNTKSYFGLDAITITIP